jgi:hypothetical protein
MLEHIAKVQYGITVRWHTLSDDIPTEVFYEKLKNGTITYKDHEIINKFIWPIQHLSFDSIFKCVICANFTDRIIFIGKDPYCLNCHKKMVTLDKEEKEIYKNNLR